MSVELSITDGVIDFGGVKALDGVSMRFDNGLAYGVIGPNGSGKSTLLAALTRLIDLDAGRLERRGEEYTSAPRYLPARLGIARTFQTVRLLRRASVLENVMVGASVQTATRHPGIDWIRPWRSAREERRIREQAMAALDRVGLASAARSYPEGLPYGVQRKVEIARALAADPDILLLDEPVAGMIQEERAEVLALLKKLRSEGLTQVLVEHDLAMVYALCDHAYVLNFGKVIASGPPRDVARSPEVRLAYIGDHTDDDTHTDGAHSPATGTDTVADAHSPVATS